MVAKAKRRSKKEEKDEEKVVDPRFVLRPDQKDEEEKERVEEEKDEEGDPVEGGSDEENEDEEEEDSDEDDEMETSSARSDELEDEKKEVNFEEKQRKTGVLYFSMIPPKFTVVRLREYFDKVAPGEIGRIYLMRNKHTKVKDSKYKEGWMEVKKKKVAKDLAARVDNTPVGGKRRDYVSSILWNIKYLSGFKWVHLTEQLQFEKRVEQRRMQVEIAQARRVAAHFEEQVEKGRHLKKLEQKVLAQGGKWQPFTRDVGQKAVTRGKKTSKKQKKATTATPSEDLMKMIFDR
ncbi:unnamed protein product [Caenorhabditis auriculariae]|uniref:Activator of basal transcription 1 n=1 Tax=Caenorhabditis auriculariae TaxID=2777116 RepID=A0A8S1GSN1_9PELO|nr:unnamed protein product [Caenorhabditis auriculariae]